MEKLEDAREAKNGTLFNSYTQQMRSQTCSFQEQTICCCGPEQKSPNQLELPNNEKVLLKMNGMFSDDSSFFNLLRLTIWKHITLCFCQKKVP